MTESQPCHFLEVWPWGSEPWFQSSWHSEDHRDGTQSTLPITVMTCAMLLHAVPCYKHYQATSREQGCQTTSQENIRNTHLQPNLNMGS